MAPNVTQAPLLRDVIDIKTSISTSDFVLKLAEAVSEEGTALALRDYVVTERLLENFDEALGLIKAALDGHTSKAAYLHGSFGSGKSHFMAVLHALLRGDQAARARSDFDPVLGKHEWLGGERRRFLLVPYHMLGAKSLEQRVLGGYVSHVKALHPGAPTPQVYRTDSLFEDIRSHRQRMGDEKFIEGSRGRTRTRGPAPRVTMRTTGVSRSPGRLSCFPRRSPPRSWTAARSVWTWSIRVRRPSCGPSWCMTRVRPGSPGSPATRPRTSTVSSRWTPVSR